MELSIRHFIAKHIDKKFNPNDSLPFATSVKQIPKRTHLTKFDQVERCAYFLREGIVKIGMIRDGEDRIVEFFFPGSFFSSYTSFLTQLPSDVEVECLTDCEVELIRYDDLQLAYKDSLLANRMVTEQYYIQKTEREKGFLTQSAPERYRELIMRRPELVQQIPVKMIAQYLGIQPESLSRIRKEISL